MSLIPQDGTPIPDDEVRILMCERDGLVDVLFLLQADTPVALLASLEVGRRVTFGADWPIHDGKSARRLGVDLTLALHSATITGSPEGMTVRVKGLPCDP